jgi:hypothetical protein
MCDPANAGFDHGVVAYIIPEKKTRKRIDCCLVRFGACLPGLLHLDQINLW